MTLEVSFSTLTANILGRLRNNGVAELICQVCDKPIRIGDKYHRNKYVGKTRNYYHLECFKKLYR